MAGTKELVVVTGSGGFIGSAVVEKLARRFVVVGMDREGAPEPPAAAETIAVDLTSDESVEHALGRLRASYGARVASVIHLAAYFDLTGEPNPKYEQVTVRGTERLLRGLQSFELEQFVFASTMLVHATGRKGAPIDEEWPLDPKLPYRASKVRTEKLLREQRGPSRWSWRVRPASTTTCAARRSSPIRLSASMSANWSAISIRATSIRGSRSSISTT